MHTFILLQNLEQFLVVTFPTVGRCLLYSRKSAELWLVNNPELLVEVYFKKCRFYLFHTSIYFC